METSSARTRLPRGNHGQQHASLPSRTEVQRDFSAEDRGRAVELVIVDEGPAAAHWVFHIGEGRGFPVVLVVFSADRERDAKSRRHDDRGRPDLEVELDDFAGLQGLPLVVGVVRTVMQRTRRIELPLRCAQPALSDGRARVERALERDLLSFRGEHAQHREDVRVGGGRGDEELERRGPGDLGFAPEGRGGEGHAFARRVVGNGPFSAKRRRRQPHFLRIKVEMRPRRARERPFALVAQHEFFGQARVQLQVRHAGEKFVLRHESEWPLARTAWTHFHLDPKEMRLSTAPFGGERSITYDATGEGVTFSTPPLGRETEITGPSALKLFISSSTADADIFAVLRVFDPKGKEVSFQGALDPRTPVGQGWLRASQRKLDPTRSLHYPPYHTHDESQHLKPGEVVELDLDIWSICIVVTS